MKSKLCYVECDINPGDRSMFESFVKQHNWSTKCNKRINWCSIAYQHTWWCLVQLISSLQKSKFPWISIIYKMIVCMSDYYPKISFANVCNLMFVFIWVGNKLSHSSHLMMISSLYIFCHRRRRRRRACSYCCCYCFKKWNLSKARKIFSDV